MLDRHSVEDLLIEFGEFEKYNMIRHQGIQGGQITTHRQIGIVHNDDARTRSYSGGYRALDFTRMCALGVEPCGKTDAVAIVVIHFLIHLCDRRSGSDEMRFASLSDR